MANGNQDILQLIGQLVGRVGAEFGKQQTGLARGATQGAAALGKLLGVASTQRPGVAGEQQRIGKEIEQQLNPLQENVLKKVQKVHGEQVEEAMAQGASGEQILADAGISISGDQPTDEEGKPDGTALALAGQQPPELTEKQQGFDLGKFLFQPTQVSEKGEVTPANILGGLIQAAPSTVRAELENQILGQQIRGVTPIQPKEILKETLDAEKAGKLTPQNLFNQFNKGSQVFVQTRDAQARIEAAAVDPSAAGDLALIFNFMKVLDPGSTVREGEFANAQNSAGIPDRIRGSYNRVLQGKRLAPKQRGDFVDRSRKLFGAIEKQQSKHVKEFQALGRRNNIDPSVFITDKGLVTGQQTQPGTQGVTQSGNKFRRK